MSELKRSILANSRAIANLAAQLKPEFENEEVGPVTTTNVDRLQGTAPATVTISDAVGGTYVLRAVGSFNLTSTQRDYEGSLQVEGTNVVLGNEIDYEPKDSTGQQVPFVLEAVVSIAANATVTYSYRHAVSVTGITATLQKLTLSLERKK